MCVCVFSVSHTVYLTMEIIRVCTLRREAKTLQGGAGRGGARRGETGRGTKKVITRHRSSGQAKRDRLTYTSLLQLIDAGAISFLRPAAGRVISPAALPFDPSVLPRCRPPPRPHRPGCSNCVSSGVGPDGSLYVCVCVRARVCSCLS